MPPGQIILLVYAALLLAGGWIGFQKARSRTSLRAGIFSALLLFVAFFTAKFGAPAAGYWIGAAVAFLMCVIFVIRLLTTGKVMPSGALLALSLAAVGSLAYFAFTSAPTPQ